MTHNGRTYSRVKSIINLLGHDLALKQRVRVPQTPPHIIGVRVDQAQIILGALEVAKNIEMHWPIRPWREFIPQGAQTRDQATPEIFVSGNAVSSFNLRDEIFDPVVSDAFAPTTRAI